MKNYELYHHGIKGQKWGVRRTAAQLGHRIAGAASKTGKAVGKFTKTQATKAKKAASDSYKQYKKETKEKKYYAKLHKKKLSQMTDKEIQDLTNRVKKEANLKDAKYESRMGNARKFYNNVAKEPLKTAATVYSKAAVEKMFKDDKSDSNKSNNDKKDDSPRQSKIKEETKKRAKEAVDKVNERPVKSNNPPTIRR